ncbi:MAG: hemophore-related protein [Nocardia sp.]|nr:hemophore-related protein [Nocardia sp.]
MKRTVAALLTGTAGIAALAIAVPGVASADAPQCDKQTRAQLHQQIKPQVDNYLNSHPDLKAEMGKLKGMPKDQRKAEMKNYRQGHQQEMQDLKNLRKPMRDHQQACHPGKK